MRTIATAERLHPEGRGDPSYFARRWGHGPIPDPDTVSGRRVPAYISWGRWIAECPDCRSAQPTGYDDHRFLCAECGNMGLGWHEVRWPTNMEAIEAVLLYRPYPATRNWLPGESLASLQAENAKHHLPTGGPDPAAMQRALGYRRSHR